MLLPLMCDGELEVHVSVVPAVCFNGWAGVGGAEVPAALQ